MRNLHFKPNTPLGEGIRVLGTTLASLLLLLAVLHLSHPSPTAKASEARLAQSITKSGV